MTIAWLPLVLYAAAAAAYLAHFARHEERTGRLATALLGGAGRAHTFLIGMQTMEAATRRSSARPPRFGVRLAALASPTSLELTTDERAMGPSSRSC